MQKDKIFYDGFELFTKFSNETSIVYERSNHPVKEKFIEISNGEITIFNGQYGIVALSENGLSVERLTFKASEINKFKQKNKRDVIIDDLMPHGKTAVFPISEDMFNDIKKHITPSGNRGKLLSASRFFCVIAILLLLGMLIYTHMDSSGTHSPSSGSTATVTCQSCGRSFQKGSDNAKSINRTNMCSNCYNNFKKATDALKELPVN